MDRSLDNPLDLVAAEPREPSQEVAPRAERHPQAWPPPFRARRGPVLLAQARRHWLWLAGPVLVSAGVTGAGCGVLALTPALHSPLALALATLGLCAILVFTLVLPLASWHAFRMDVFDDRIVVQELRGLLVRHEQHPFGYTVVTCDRWPWDYLLGTGTVKLCNPVGCRSYRLVTPVGWVAWITPH
jgi:hypothetical protein